VRTSGADGQVVRRAIECNDPDQVQGEITRPEEQVG
jgi:hypothetical protein